MRVTTLSKLQITRRLFHAAMAVALATPIAAAESDARFFGPIPPGSRPRVVVPVGSSRLAPANTARAIATAIEDGFDCVEVQVRRTKDGQHIVFDSDRLDGITSGVGETRQHTLAEIRALDAGSWFARRFAGAKIQTLAECLQLCQDRIGLILDCRDVDPEALVRELAAASLSRQVLVTGPMEVLARIRELSGGSIALLAQLPSGEDLEGWLSKTKPAAVLLTARDLTVENCRALHEQKFAVLAAPADEHDPPETSWDALIAAGVDMVRTSTPEEFVVHAIARRVKDRPVLIAAHRGASRYAPENTRLSLAKAARMQADFVEIDVHTTVDGAFFLLHDGTLDRTTTGHDRVRQATAAMMRELDAGAWFGKPFIGTPVPELDDYLAHFPAEMGLYFDAKDIAPEALAAAVERHGLVERTVVYQGPVYLEKLKALNPRIRLLAPVGTASHVDTLAKRLAPYAVDTPWKLLSPEYIEHCHSLGIKVFSDAKGDTAVDDYRHAIEWGIDLVQTDYPLRLWQAIEMSSRR
jgi:glycerophosphoryl diester phosphodiesterase